MSSFFRLRQRALLLIAAVLTVIGGDVIGLHRAAMEPTGLLPSPIPTPTLDRLAAPVMPASPGPIDFGRQVYYTNCMPCHGDRGQGLTDEWRAVWVEDHQNCWAHGCHGGRRDDEGYPLPHYIPPVMGLPPVLTRFTTFNDLYDYLRQTHPPQRPGVLTDDDYRNVTALLWQANGRSIPAAAHSPTSPVPPIGLGLLFSALAIVFVMLKRLKRKQLK
jgi:hypothetical protein